MSLPTVSSRDNANRRPAGGTVDSLRQRTARGFAWIIAQAVATRVVTLVGQILLARLLFPADFGLFGLAMTAYSFGSILRTGGIAEVLIHRQTSFHIWRNAAFWISTTSGCLGAVVAVAVSPLAAIAFHSQVVGYLVLIVALSIPLDSLSVVPEAWLRIQLRFRAIGVVNTYTHVLQWTCAVLLAWHGWGAFSPVVAIPIATAVRSGSLWLVARPGVSFHLHLRRWRYLLGDNVRLIIAGFAYALQGNGDYMILGLLHPKQVVGTYFFAFNLSTQTMTLLGFNLGGVLFPALGKLNDDPKRQLNGFLRSARLLAIVAVPFCLLQAVLAGPGIRILFGPRWYSAIPVLQVLSLAWSVAFFAHPAANLIQAQGRFRMHMLIGVLGTGLFLAAVLVAALLGGALSVAIAVGITIILIEFVRLLIAIKPAGGTWAEIGHVIAPAMGAAVLAVGIATGAARLVAQFPHADYLQIAIILSGTAAIYLPIIRWMDPESWETLFSLLKGLKPSTPGVPV